MRKICFVITARPSYSRVRSALCSLRKLVNVDLQIILTASALLDRYGNVAHEVESDGFYISSRVFTVLEGESPVTMAKTTGIGIIELTSEFQRLKPDLVVTIADRFETLATAISTTYLGIPLVHLQVSTNQTPFPSIPFQIIAVLAIPFPWIMISLLRSYILSPASFQIPRIKLTCFLKH